jgi:hypothetical protein
MKKLNLDGYRLLHNAACSGWRITLEEKFSSELALTGKTVVKDSFYEAMKSACSTSQRVVLDSVFGVEKEGEPFVFGEWYNLINSPKVLVFIKDAKNAFGFNHNGEWTNGWGVQLKDCKYKKADDEKVVKRLLQEAKDRGFVEGAFHNSYTTSDGVAFEIKGEIIAGWNGKIDTIHAKDSQGLIFRGGKWAEVVIQTKKMTHRQIERALGYKIEIIS